MASFFGNQFHLLQMCQYTHIPGTVSVHFSNLAALCCINVIYGSGGSNFDLSSILRQSHISLLCNNCCACIACLLICHWLLYPITYTPRMAGAKCYNVSHRFLRHLLSIQCQSPALACHSDGLGFFAHFSLHVIQFPLQFRKISCLWLDDTQYLDQYLTS